MASTRKYDLNHINSGQFVDTFKKKKPNLIDMNRNEDCERVANQLIKAIQIALDNSCPQFNNTNNQSKQNSIVYRLPRNVSDLFLISRSLLNENRRKMYRSSNYQTIRSNYSKRDFFEKQLTYYIGDQCSNKMINKKIVKSINIESIDENKIKDLIFKLPQFKLPGLDYIPNEVWQCILKCNEEYLINFINILVQKAYFPKIFKQGKLIVFRKPYRSGYDPENYRFITVQSSICKIYERLLVQKLRDQQLMNYLNRVTNQHGFTRNKSRYSALKVIVNEMNLVKASRRYGVLIQLDIKRAFDLISWDHILKVVEQNFDNEKFLLISEILRSRSIKLNEYTRDCIRGLPQGSPSSHLLWLISTSPLMLELLSIDDVTSAGFIDDFMLLVKGDTVTSVINKVNEIKMVFENWLKSAALHLNENKCWYMQFSGKTKINLMDFEIDRAKLRGTGELKYLGIYLNKNLDFNRQVYDIQIRIKEALKAVQTIFAYTERKITYEDRIQIYTKSIKPILTNGWSIWAKEIVGFKGLTDKLRNCQKRALVVLFNESDYNRNVELCRKHQIFPIDIDLQIKICMQLGSDKNRRRLTKKECQIIELKVMQENYFYWN